MAKAERKISGGLLLGLRLAAIFFLGVVYGAASARYEFFPYTSIRAAFMALDAYHERAIVYAFDDSSDPDQVRVPRSMWQAPRGRETGVIVHKPDKAFDGLVLYAAADSSSAILMTLEGNEVHRWEKGFYDIWPNPPHLGTVELVKSRMVNMRRPLLFPNGDLLVIYTAFGVTPYGYGLAKIDKDSNLIWRYDGRTHHDIDIMPDGRILALTHKSRRSRLRNYDRFRPPMIEDFLVVLSEDGVEMKEISLLQLLADSDFRYLLDLRDEDATSGILHTNTVRYIPKDFASHHEWIVEGQVMTLHREIDAALVIDLEKEEITAMIPVGARRPHDTDLLANGNIMIYDNRGHPEPGNRSRILEFNPSTRQLAWSYTGTMEEPFETMGRGVQQLLPNGNVQIFETQRGRIFEVTPDGEIVWDFRYPNLHPNTDGMAVVPNVVGGARYAREELTFLSDPG